MQYPPSDILCSALNRAPPVGDGIAPTPSTVYDQNPLRIDLQIPSVKMICESVEGVFSGSCTITERRKGPTHLNSRSPTALISVRPTGPYSPPSNCTPREFLKVPFIPLAVPITQGVAYAGPALARES